MLPQTEENIACLEASKLYCIRNDDLVFAFNGDILGDVANDLSQNIPEGHGLIGTVLVGIHKIFAVPRISGRRVGVQTEQLFDSHGKKMWKNFHEPRMRRHANGLDGVLDFSFSNTPAYAALRWNRQQKIWFGPYVFPDFPVRFRARGSGITYVGSQSERRKPILEGLAQAHPLKIADQPIFGKDVAAFLTGGAGVLNIHHTEGIYSEVPRILKTYMAGKILYSEELAYPFIAGRHYLPLSDLGSPSRDPRDIFATLQREIALPFRFSLFLQRFLQL
ncbi:hypothetical protein SAMN05421538_1012 [Paracoccus isoporae]|uniref:Uncharacterized protein n=1 Tax=Paracoccus isoporae TaxID=591205 RepID=A0A1G6SKI1_9RHOB|nr:hypothetical protein SAMN05421538_1012 [Paracoccus isoporae]